MKPKEISIGCWVTHNSTPMQIAGVHTNPTDKSDWPSFCLRHPSTNNVFIAKECDIEPIRISYKILEKNGFKKEKTWQWVDKSRQIILTNQDEYMNSNNDWYVHLDNDDFETIGAAELTYVHQLQIFLTLCGIEKDIIV